MANNVKKPTTDTAAQPAPAAAPTPALAPAPAAVIPAKVEETKDAKAAEKKAPAKAAEKKKPGRKPAAKPAEKKAPAKAAEKAPAKAAEKKSKAAEKKAPAKAAEKKKPGRKPAVKPAEKKAPAKAAEKKPAAKATKAVEKKTPGRKPAAKKAEAPKATGKRGRTKTISFEDIVTKARAAVKRGSFSKISKKIAATVEVVGKTQQAFYILIEGGKASVEPYKYDDADLWIKGSAGDIAAILDKKIEFADAISKGIIEIWGEAKDAVVFTEAVF